jgi:hypothetical protein
MCEAIEKRLFDWSYWTAKVCEHVEDQVMSASTEDRAAGEEDLDTRSRACLELCSKTGIQRAPPTMQNSVIKCSMKSVDLAP